MWEQSLLALTKRNNPLHLNFSSENSGWLCHLFLTTYLLTWISTWWFLGLPSSASLPLLAVTSSPAPSQWFVAEAEASIFWWCDLQADLVLPHCCITLQVALLTHYHYYFQSRAARRLYQMRSKWLRKFWLDVHHTCPLPPPCQTTG